MLPASGTPYYSRRSPWRDDLVFPSQRLDSYPARGRRNETVEDRQLAMVEIWNPEDPATVIWLDSLFAHDDGLLGAVALEPRQAAWTGKGSLPGRAEYYERYRLFTNAYFTRRPNRRRRHPPSRLRRHQNPRPTRRRQRGSSCR